MKAALGVSCALAIWVVKAKATAAKEVIIERMQDSGKKYRSKLKLKHVRKILFKAQYETK